MALFKVFNLKYKPVMWPNSNVALNVHRFSIPISQSECNFHCQFILCHSEHVTFDGINEWMGSYNEIIRAFLSEVLLCEYLNERRRPKTTLVEVERNEVLIWISKAVVKIRFFDIVTCEKCIVWCFHWIFYLFFAFCFTVQNVLIAFYAFVDMI